MGVREPEACELVARPLVRALQPRRASQARTDLLAQVGQRLPDVAVLAALVEQTLDRFRIALARGAAHERSEDHEQGARVPTAAHRVEYPRAARGLQGGQARAAPPG
jgi:hypothetical protein